MTEVAIKKPYRVTQYQQLSELGRAFMGVNIQRASKVGHKDYRWLWTARISAFLHRGESAGFGLRTLTTTITDLRTEPTHEH